MPDFTLADGEFEAEAAKAAYDRKLRKWRAGNERRRERWAEHPELRDEYNARQREKREAESLKRQRIFGNEEYYPHTEEWLAQEVADLRAHPKPTDKVTRTKPGRMNPEMACILRARVLRYTGVRI